MGDTGTQGAGGTEGGNAQGGAAAGAGAEPGGDSKGAQGAQGAGTAAGGKAAAGGTQEPKGDGTKAAGSGGEPKGQETTPSGLELKLPDGVEADPQMLDEFKAFAQEAKLDGQAAQKIVDIYAKAYQGSLQRQSEAFQQQQQQWVKAIQDDKELGGANLKATQAITDRAMKAFSTPELIKHLDESGTTNHPEMVRLFHRIGKQMKEDAIAGTSAQQGGSGKPTEKEVARARYSNTKW